MKRTSVFLAVVALLSLASSRPSHAQWPAAVADQVLDPVQEREYALIRITYKKFFDGTTSHPVNNRVRTKLFDVCAEYGVRRMFTVDFSNWPAEDSSFGVNASIRRAWIKPFGIRAREALGKDATMVAFRVDEVVNDLDLEVTFERFFTKLRVPLQVSAWQFVDPGKTEWLRAPFACPPPKLRDALVRDLPLPADLADRLRHVKSSFLTTRIRIKAPGLWSEFSNIKLVDFKGRCQ